MPGRGKGDGMKKIALLSVILLMAACTKPAASSGTPVTIVDFAFSPESVNVSVGDTVTWTNTGSSQHTSTSGAPGAPDGTWDSGTLSNGGTFSHVFGQAGNFHYYCRFHGASGMTGVVSVH